MPGVAWAHVGPAGGRGRDPGSFQAPQPGRPAPGPSSGPGCRPRGSCGSGAASESQRLIPTLPLSLCDSLSVLLRTPVPPFPPLENNVMMTDDHPARGGERVGSLSGASDSGICLIKGGHDFEGKPQTHPTEVVKNPPECFSRYAERTQQPPAPRGSASLKPLQASRASRPAPLRRGHRDGRSCQRGVLVGVRVPASGHRPQPQPGHGDPRKP